MSGTNARRSFYLFLIALGATLWFSGVFTQILAQNDARNNTGVILQLNGAVTPASADYLIREIETANDSNHDLIIMEIDTPGGLVTSMQGIIKAVLGSDAPVVTYVSPQGSRSASAGLYIMYAAHVSAMAPATNTGAATPVEIGGGGGGEESPLEDRPVFPELEEETPEAPAEEAVADETAGSDAEAADASAEPVSAEAPEEGAVEPDLEDIPAYSSEDALRKKIINDSVAYIRSLAEERGRNADWAERAVRDAVSITANEALELNVIDLIADDLDDLLKQIDGKVVKTAAGDVTISTQNIQLERVEPALWERILGFFADPNVAAILLSLGTLGITAEIWNPGSIFPGAFGLICLLLALYSFSVLPYNALSLALMGVGLVLIIIEAYSPTFGLSGLSGLAIFGAGLYFLFPDQFRVSPSVIVTMMVLGGAFLAAILIAIVGSRGHGPMIGAEAIRKREGTVDEWNNDTGEGMVIVEGERWRARSKQPLQPGDKIKVVEMDGLVLDVKSAQGQPSRLSRFLTGKRKARKQCRKNGHQTDSIRSIRIMDKQRRD